MNCVKCEKPSPSIVSEGDLCRECMGDQDVRTLREKALSLQAALDFYGDRRRYTRKDGVGFTVPPEILGDEGARARSALTKG